MTASDFLLKFSDLNFSTKYIIHHSNLHKILTHIKLCIDLIKMCISQERFSLIQRMCTPFIISLFKTFDVKPMDQSWNYRHNHSHKLRRNR